MRLLHKCNASEGGIAYIVSIFQAQWLSWLERRPVTAEVTGSSPVWVVYFISGVLAQLGEHLPYKQRVIGSSPIGPIYDKVIFLLN